MFCSPVHLTMMICLGDLHYNWDPKFFCTDKNVLAWRVLALTAARGSLGKSHFNYSRIPKESFGKKISCFMASSLKESDTITELNVFNEVFSTKAAAAKCSGCNFYLPNLSKNNTLQWQTEVLNEWNEVTFLSKGIYQSFNLFRFPLINAKQSNLSTSLCSLSHSQSYTCIFQMQLGQQWQCYLFKGLQDSTWLNAFLEYMERNPEHQTAFRFGMHQNVNLKFCYKSWIYIRKRIFWEKHTIF